MSVSPVSASSGSSSSLSAYAPYDPPSAPAGLDAIQRGVAAAPGPAVASTPGQPTVYQSELASLNQADAAELIQNSLASPSTAASNVASVLSQATTLLAQQQAAQQQQAASSSTQSINADPTGALNVPTLGSIIQASDTAANADLTGTNVNTTA